MEQQIVFRPNQQVLADDFDNLEAFARDSFDHIVNDGIDPGQKYYGLAAQKTGPTEVTVASGRYYSAGMVFIRATSTVFPVLANLPAATQKIGTVVVWGLPSVDGDTETRKYLIDPVLRTFEIREVAMQSTRALQMDIIFGVESAAPARGTIDSSVIPVADILLNTSGVISVTMDDSTRLRSVNEAQGELDDLTTWRATIGQAIDTLRTDLAKLRASIPPDLTAAVKALAGQIANILAILNKPAAAIATFVDRFVNLSDSNTAHAGYAAKVEDGLVFPSTFAQGPITLLNPIDPKVITVNNITLPAYTPVARYTLMPPQKNFTGLKFVFVTSFPALSRAYKIRYLSRRCVRYGDAFTSVIAQAPATLQIATLTGESVVADQSSGPGLAEIARRPDPPYYKCLRPGGEPYTVDWQTFWAKAEVARLIALRQNYAWVDYYDRPYWDAIIQSGTIAAGSTFGYVFLNQSNGWMTHVRLWLRDIGPSGDVTIQVCQVDDNLRPDSLKVMAHATWTKDNLFAGKDGTLIPVTPTYLEGGRHYAILISTPGDHSFYVIEETEFLAYGLLPGVFWYWETTSVWVLASPQRHLFMQIMMAQFSANRVELQLTPMQLAGGITAVRGTAAMFVPPGTGLSWEVQNGGVWYPLDATSPAAFAGSPALLPFRAVFSGTSDLMPAIDLTQTELEVSRTSTTYTHWSRGRTLGSSATSIVVQYYLSNWDAAHDTLDCRIEIGGVTSGVAGAIVTTVNPQDPTKVSIKFTHTVASTTTYDIKTVGTTVAGFGFFIVTERWDDPFA